MRRASAAVMTISPCLTFVSALNLRPIMRAVALRRSLGLRFVDLRLRGISSFSKSGPAKRSALFRKFQAEADSRAVWVVEV